jgi:hypothetical protein
MCASQPQAAPRTSALCALRPLPCCAPALPPAGQPPPRASFAHQAEPGGERSPLAGHAAPLRRPVCPPSSSGAASLARAAPALVRFACSTLPALPQPRRPLSRRGLPRRTCHTLSPAPRALDQTPCLSALRAPHSPLKPGNRVQRQRCFAQARNCWGRLPLPTARGLPPPNPRHTSAQSPRQPRQENSRHAPLVIHRAARRPTGPPPPIRTVPAASGHTGRPGDAPNVRSPTRPGRPFGTERAPPAPHPPPPSAPPPSAHKAQRQRSGCAAPRSQRGRGASAARTMRAAAAPLSGESMRHARRRAACAQAQSAQSTESAPRFARGDLAGTHVRPACAPAHTSASCGAVRQSRAASACASVSGPRCACARSRSSAYALRAARSAIPRSRGTASTQRPTRRSAALRPAADRAGERSLRAAPSAGRAAGAPAQRTAAAVFNLSIIGNRLSL